MIILRIDNEDDARWLANCAMGAIEQSYEKNSVRHNEMTALHVDLTEQINEQTAELQPGIVKINSNDIYWVVNPTLTDKTNRGEKVIKLEWGFDWDGNQILMTKSMAEMLRNSLNEMLEKI